ncbi:MAG: alpha-L-arabinofuranosidase C-terminal domain-containing protein, partial [Anaerolineae bacterium]|nr:alpha-L-arabinofuranosidase C-terminal domain-containing protein [Anaerolineae bacterium]
AGRVGLFVDEWGVWHNVEPGTNPGFLYQQNTLRDALVAGITLNIFNQHSDRVRGANIAQTVNVLQAMVLTQEEAMILTPTYHVFEMYKDHQDAMLLPVDVKSPPYSFGDQSIPAVSVSASRSENGAINLSLCNLDPHRDQPFICHVRGIQPRKISGRVLTGHSIHAHNTFAHPNLVKPQPFSTITLVDGAVEGVIPSKSVAVLKIG